MTYLDKELADELKEMIEFNPEEHKDMSSKIYRCIQYLIQVEESYDECPSCDNEDDDDYDELRECSDRCKEIGGKWYSLMDEFNEYEMEEESCSYEAYELFKRLEKELINYGEDYYLKTYINIPYEKKTIEEKIMEIIK